ncbi:MAG: hypothetical protein V1753_04020 [Pseudomonadota bacterium]
MLRKSSNRRNGDFVEQVLFAESATGHDLLCYWAVRELGISMAQIARQLNLLLSSVSKSVKRGEAIVQQKGYNLIDP